jgi:molecular chaperone GrpE
VSEGRRKREDPTPESPQVEEESGGTLPPNPELEDALREAVEAVEGHTDEFETGAPEGRAEQDPAAELERAQEQLIRLQADFENFRRRALAERHDIYQYGHENLVKDLLATVDNLDRAVGHARESGGGDLESLLQGVELVQRELVGILANHSVREVEALGKDFDPALHEALAQIPDGSVAPNTVTEVLQKGYQLRDRLLRPAGVVVAKAPDEAEAPETAPEEGNGGEAAG